ncbi:MAG: hypothetical protein NDI61_03700 [Bdellovibrionaceae bacterium]|nr:hypothetical protein [Pseudobdellovibrionaceae bacterium]
MMSGKTDWMEKFRVTETNLEKWRNEAGPNEDLLRWCLLNGKITESDYLQWACEHYELPTVEAQFFSLPPDTDFWEKIRTSGPWSPSLIPLHEWQGMLLVACVSPDPQARVLQPHRFVLSSARALDMLWKTLNHNLDHTTRAGLAATTSVTIPLNATVSPEKVPDGIASISPTAAPSVAEAPVAAAPDGFVLKDLFANESQVQEPVTEDVTAGPPADAPDGLGGLGDLINVSRDLPHFGDTTGSGAESLNSLNFDVPATTPATALASHQESPPPPPEELTPIPTPPSFQPPPVDVAPVAAKAQPSAKLPPVVVPPPIEPAAPVAKPTPAASNRTALDMSQMGQTAHVGTSSATDFAQCANLDDVTAVAFKKMQPVFQKSLILVFQSGQLRPWKWSSGVSHAGKSKASAIQLEEPSIFKIVYSTALPYHGYVVTNPTNNAFFAEFNGGTVPAHVTIMPILVNGQIAGMLMGMTDAQINLKATLRQMEALTDDVSRALTRIRSAKVA